MHTRAPTHHSAPLTAALLLALCATTPSAIAGSTAPASGPVLDLRYRYESVDDAALQAQAQANTVRLRLGYRWVIAPGWQLYADGEHIETVFGEHYNSTANGLTQYPVVADPQADEINQAFVAFAGEHAGATLGRQRIQLDNQRFFGNVGWRQNEQTFDALALNFAPIKDGPVVRYLYLDRVLRVNGHENPNPLQREWSLDGHLLNVSQDLSLGHVSGYAYVVKNDDIVNLSTRTLGARWNGRHAFANLALGWVLEVADQHDWANNPIAQSSRYWLVEPNLELHGIAIRAGWEVLGGNGHVAFSTPYATLHGFNGWADRFLTTPANGLDDRHVGASGKLGSATWSTTWHDYRADSGSQDYGHELDASISMPFGKHFSGLLKLADYRSDGYSTDVRKLWASVEYHY